MARSGRFGSTPAAPVRPACPGIEAETPTYEAHPHDRPRARRPRRCGRCPRRRRRRARHALGLPPRDHDRHGRRHGQLRQREPCPRSRSRRPRRRRRRGRSCPASSGHGSRRARGRSASSRLQSNKKAVIIVREKPLVGTVQLSAIGKGGAGRLRRAPDALGHVDRAGHRDDRQAGRGRARVEGPSRSSRPWPASSPWASWPTSAPNTARRPTPARPRRTCKSSSSSRSSPSRRRARRSRRGARSRSRSRSRRRRAGISVDVDRWDAKRKRWRQVARKSVNTATGLVKVVWAVPKGTTRLRADLQRAKRGFTRTTTPVLSVSGT